jgi:hypothetical protein
MLNNFLHAKLINMKSLTRSSACKWALLVCISLFIFSSCQKQFDEQQQQWKNALDKGRNDGDKNDEEQINKVDVSSVDELYNAVNNAANAGSKIVLAPGNYILDPHYPNAGRIELQFDMALMGQRGHADQVIIDASALPGTSFLLPPRPAFPTPGRTGAIRMGNGSNAVEWLTIRGNPNPIAYSVITTDLITTPVTHDRVAHCIVTGGQIGIHLQNLDPESNGRIIEAEIAYNECTGNLVGFGQGIGIFNSRDVRGASIRATLHDNYVHGNRMGIRAFNIVANQCNITIQSKDDRFEENGTGLVLNGAFNEYPNFTVNDNFLSFEAHGTTILNNLGVPSLPTGSAKVIPGGILAIGAQVSANSFPGTASGNRLEIDLKDCRIENNALPYDINAFGARSTYPSANPAGTNNVVTIALHGLSENATVGVTPSFPAEPAGTNVVNLLQ